MEQRGIVAGIAVRLGITLFWGLVILIFLLLPRLHFYERNSITVFAWSGIFSEEYIRKFEKETGIKVYISYYASNEELLVKLRATGGKGYDLVVPSDYAVKKLIEDGFLKKLDKQKLNFMQELNPLLMGHAFDPRNDYAIPFVWELYLIGATRSFLQKHKVTAQNAWDLIFKPQTMESDYRLIMVNDSIEAIAMATHYLFGDKTEITTQEKNAIQALLFNQRPWVEAYSNVRSDYYLGTNNAMTAVAHSAEMWRALRDYTNIDFVVPRDTFVTIEHCAIPTTSTKDDLVYRFLNYFYTQESFKYHFSLFKSCPARRDVIDQLDASPSQKDIMTSSEQVFFHYLFVRDLLSEKDKHNLWISVKI